MTFYHISLDIHNVVSEFQPRIPGHIHHMENTDTPRICLSDSIGGCLSAVPWGGISFENTSSEFFELNEEEIHLAFRVYEFEETSIHPSNLISTDDLLKKGLVMDACNSNEVWVIEQSLTPSKTYIVLLTNYTEGVGDVFIPEYYHLTDEDDIDIEDYMEGCSTIFSNLVYEAFSHIDEIPYAIDWKEWDERKEEFSASIINS